MQKFFIITILFFCETSYSVYVYNAGTSHAKDQYQINPQGDEYNDKYVYPYGNVDEDYGIVNMTLLSMLTPVHTTETTKLGKKKTETGVGLYDVQTGDELFLNDFDMRPKFKTKNDSKHILGYEYISGKYGQMNNGALSQRVTSTRSTPTDNPRYGLNRRPQTKLHRKGNKTNTNVKKPNLQNPNRPHRKNQHRPSTNQKNTIQKHKNKRKPVQQNKKKVQRKQQNSGNVCKNVNVPLKNIKGKLSNKVNNKSQHNGLGHKKKIKGNVRRKNNKRFTKRQSKYPNAVSDVIKKYLTGLKSNRQGHRERSLFGMTFDQIRNQSTNLANKFLSLFNTVGHPNYRCTTSGVQNLYEGMCYQKTQCLELGGTVLGNCTNYGVCCVFKLTCGATSNQNYSYLQSPNYDQSSDTETTTSNHLDYEDVTPHYVDEPITDEFSLDPSLFTEEVETTSPVTYEGEESYMEFSGEGVTENSRNKYKEYTIAREEVDDSECIFEIFKAGESIQQMKIDFVDLELTGPDGNGNCAEEKLIITGRNTKLPVICGYNSGQHVYVDVSTLSGPLQISILSKDKYSKRYNMRVSQLETPCDNSMNCMQYFTGIRGIVTSFNYDQASRYSKSKPSYLNNLNYAVCIRREIGYCSTTFTNVDEENNEYPFDMRNSAEDVDDSCPQDFILINNVRFCGQTFREITDPRPGPIMLSVQTDARITGRGFKLFYKQNKCIN